MRCVQCNTIRCLDDGKLSNEDAQQHHVVVILDYVLCKAGSDGSHDGRSSGRRRGQSQNLSTFYTPFRS
jgi:hypothetical protein